MNVKMDIFKSKRNTEEKIKEATFELLADKGYAQVSMRDIAKKAQTAVGQLTYYYGTKEHLIISVISEMTSGVIDELEKYIIKKKDKIKAINSFFDKVLEADEKVYRVLLDFSAQSIWSEAFKSSINTFLDKVYELLFKSYIENGYNELYAKKEANDFITTTLGKMMRGVLF